jgi:predicted 3-demethylubiquinone-9 3-methyltransferase (glyoxalase superfamily)
MVGIRGIDSGHSQVIRLWKTIQTIVYSSGDTAMQKIILCLWFNNQAEEAARFYTSIFKTSKINEISYYGETGPGPKGSVLTVTFQLNGYEIMALNGGPDYHFTPAISIVVYCEDQLEVDHYWEKLSEAVKKGHGLLRQIWRFLADRPDHFRHFIERQG